MKIQNGDVVCLIGSPELGLVVARVEDTYVDVISLSADLELLPARVPIAAVSRLSGPSEYIDAKVGDVVLFPGSSIRMTVIETDGTHVSAACSVVERRVCFLKLNGTTEGISIPTTYLHKQQI